MEFRNVLIGAYSEQPTIYKLKFGKKNYYIWKGKNLRHSVETICKDIDRFTRLGIKSDHLLKKVVDHVIKKNVLFCTVEVLLQTDNLTELINFENLTLAKAEKDPDCLNTKFEAHIPKWISEPGEPVVKQPTQNKPITATFSPRPVQVSTQKEKINPIAAEIAAKAIPTPSIPSGKSKIMEALSKLKK